MGAISGAWLLLRNSLLYVLWTDLVKVIGFRIPLLGFFWVTVFLIAIWAISGLSSWLGLGVIAPGAALIEVVIAQSPINGAVLSKAERSFEDGALCRRFVSSWTDDPGTWGTTTSILDPKNSGHTIAVQIERRPTRGNTREQCAEIVPGSTAGELASWRALLGRFYNWARDNGLAVVLIQRLLPFYLLLAAGTVVIAICRGVSVARKAARIPYSSEWTGVESNGYPILIQISDLHLTRQLHPYEIDQNPSLWTGAMPTVDRFQSLLAEITDEPRLLVLSGDLTDLGEADEWVDFGRVLSGHLEQCEQRPNILLIPGNHDVSINIHSRPDPLLRGRRAREAACFEILKTFDDDLWRPKARHCSSLRTMFPRHAVVPIANLPVAQVRLLALDSNRYRSRFVNSGAVGMFGRDQLVRFERLLLSGSGPVIVVTHHHITKAHGTRNTHRASMYEDWFLLANDASDLLKVLTAYASQGQTNTVLVIHGHKHQELFEAYEGSNGGRIFIYGHPSSTMGLADPATGLDGHLRFTRIGISSTLQWTVDTSIFQARATLTQEAGETAIRT